MRHPFERWPARRRGAALLATTAAMVVAEIPLLAVNGPLTNDAAGLGIGSLQLAGSAERATEIVEAWRAGDVLHLAGFSLGLDFLLMPLYASVIAGLCVWASRRGWLAPLGVALAWGAWVAAGFDAVETGGQLALLDDPSRAGLAAVVRVAAVAKFALLGASLLYVLAGVPRALGRTRQNT